MACHPDGKITSGHFPFLVEHLTMFAYKWNEIGTALKFQPQDLRNIEASPSLIATAPSSFMQRLVEEWLEGKYPHTAPPTLANLLKALNSHTVGLGTLATQIRNSLPQHNQSVDANVFEIAAMSDQGDITFKRIEDIRVIESTQVHLEIKTSSEKQLCRWSNTHLKNSSKEQLSRQRNMEHKKELSKLCSGMNEPVVNILRADIDMDGSQFSCEIEDCNTSTNQIIPVTFRVSCPQLDNLKDRLASIYLAQPEVPQDSWPPVSNKTYINLALIKQQQSINYGGKYARLTIRGDMDDILHHKEIIKYQNIFDELKSGSLLLIEGRPGCGKTTFVNKITRDWAASEVKGPMRLVLLVSLRVLNTWDKPVTLEDILHLLNLRIEEKTLDDRNGKGVCFIFDGLDEFSPLEGEDSIVHKIINKTYLPKSFVIVASRPAALVNLRQRADKVVEVIGFPRDQIYEYFKNCFHLNRPKAVELRSYLTSHPNVLHMCYLPIHAAMVAFLLEVNGEVPRTETEIYKHFTHSTLMRSLSKKKAQDELEDIDINELLSGEEMELFSTICEHAFEITMLNKQVLDQNKKIKTLLQSKDIKGIALGLVTVDRTAGLYGFKNIYTFLHLTYQEYLAAVHISTLSDEEQQRLIERYGDTDHMRVVWKFYFGLVNFEGHDNKIRAMVNRRKEIGLFDIQCAYESQQEIVCNSLMDVMDAQIMLKDQYLTTPDFTALGYLLANYSCKPVSLSLINSEIDTEGVDTMLAEIGEKPLSVYSLSYESSNIDLRSIKKLLFHLHDLKILGLYKKDDPLSHTYENNGFFSSSMHGLKLNRVNHIYMNMLECCISRLPHYYCLDDCDFSDTVSTSLVNLKELRVNGLQVGSQTLSSIMQFCDKLTFLYLDHRYSMTYNIGKISAVNLKELSLTNVIISPKMLSGLLQFCKELTSLTLNGCTEEHAIQTLLTEFSKCKTLETVLCSSPIELEAVYHVELTKTTNKLNPAFKKTSSDILYVQGVKSDYLQTLKLVSRIQKPIPTAHLESFLPSRIKVLELHQNSFLGSSYNEDTFSSIIECIPDFSALEKLVLTGFKISHSAKFLADILGHCTALQEVDLSYCFSETPERTETIFNGLRSCTNLKILTLKSSHIRIDDVSVLSSCLQHWPKLCDLNIKEWGIGEKEYKTIAEYMKISCPKLIIDTIQKKECLPEPLMETSSCSSGLKEAAAFPPELNYVGYCIKMREKNEETKSSSQVSIGEDGAEVFADNIEYCPEQTDLVEMRESSSQEASSCSIVVERAEILADNIEYYPEQTDLVEMREKNKSSSQEASSCSIGEEGGKVFADNIEYCPVQTDLVEMREENEEMKASLQKNSSCCCTLF